MSLPADISQVRALSTRLQTVGGRVGAKASVLFRRTLFAIEADAKIMAPVDTGNLRNSISTEITGDGRFGAMTGEVGPTAEYGIYLEYGTSVMAPQPYLGPAFDRNIDAYTDALVRLADESL